MSKIKKFLYGIMLFFSINREEVIKKRYYNAGLRFGRVTSYMVYGIPTTYYQDLYAWEFWEEKYSELGYKTGSYEDWCGLGGWNEPLTNHNQKRAQNEAPILHAKEYIKAHPNGPVSAHIASHIFENAKPDEVQIFISK